MKISFSRTIHSTVVSYLLNFIGNFKKKKQKKQQLKITYSRFFEIAFLPSAKDPSEEKGEKFSGFGSIEPDVTYDSHVRASVSFIFMKFKWSLFFLM